MLIDDEDQRRQDHNARLFLLLASLTKLLRSLIQAASTRRPAPIAAPPGAFLQTFLPHLLPFLAASCQHPIYI